MAETAQRLPDLMTVEEFLAWPGDGSRQRYELVEGRPRAMAPASDTHGTIHSNLVAAILNHLRATRPGCRVVTEPGVRPRIRADWNFRIPELGVTCAPNLRGQATLPEPILIVEVLSPSNRNDTWDNIARYVTLPSVEEILIVDSEVAKIEVLRRLPDRSWPEDIETVIGPAASVRLASIDLELALRTIYADTHLDLATDA